MAVGSQDHLAAAGKHLSGELMNNCLMRRNVDTAVFFRAGKTKHMVIFVDGSSNGTQRVVAVGQYIRYREFFQS